MISEQHKPYAVRFTFELDGYTGQETFENHALNRESAMAIAGVQFGCYMTCLAYEAAKDGGLRDELARFRIRLTEVGHFEERRS